MIISPDQRMSLEVGLIGAGAAILGGVLSGIYQHLRDVFSKPRLRIQFEDCSAKESGYPYMPQASWEEGTPPQHLHWILIRVKVLNRGWRTAKNCRVYLIDLHEVHGGKPKSAAFHDSLPLPWAGWDFNPRDIPRGVRGFIDVVRFRKDVQAWNFTFQVFAGDRDALNNFAGTYRFRIAATADNASPAIREIDVDYRKDWNNLRAWSVTKTLA
jgi:hypothetical protein